jgi:hypothetical protein
VVISVSRRWKLLPDVSNQFIAVSKVPLHIVIVCFAHLAFLSEAAVS